MLTSFRVSRTFRVFILPWLLASPMVLASLDPVRFFHDGRCIYAFLSLAIGLAFENALVNPQSVAESARPEQARKDRRSFELSALTNIACFYLPVWDYLHLRAIVPRNAVTLIAGVVLWQAGGLLRIFAMRTLGRFFTMRVAVLGGHQVVREGLYRYVRHPAYTGWFLLSVGLALVFGSIIGLVGSLTFVLVLGFRVKVEEEALAEGLGEAYRGYMRDVRWRFIPRVF
jgi:protein-S-isoprenylcysteine O-methyltransferase Ste14